MIHVIERVQVEPDYNIRLDYRDGITILVDFAPVIQEGGIFSALADPAFFSQVQLGARGRSIIWPGDIDFCADALRLDGQEVKRDISSAA